MVYSTRWFVLNLTLVSGKGSSLWLWYSLDFSLTFLLVVYLTNSDIKEYIWLFLTILFGKQLLRHPVWFHAHNAPSEKEGSSPKVRKTHTDICLPWKYRILCNFSQWRQFFMTSRLLFCILRPFKKGSTLKERICFQFPFRVYPFSGVRQKSCLMPCTEQSNNYIHVISSVVLFGTLIFEHCNY